MQFKTKKTRQKQVLPRQKATKRMVGGERKQKMK
jgi:hypothetical protein